MWVGRVRRRLLPVATGSFESSAAMGGDAIVSPVADADARIKMNGRSNRKISMVS